MGLVCMRQCQPSALKITCKVRTKILTTSQPTPPPFLYEIIEIRIANARSLLTAALQGIFKECIFFYLQLKNGSNPAIQSCYELMIRSEYWPESFTGYLNTWMWFWRKLNHRVQLCICDSQYFLKHV